MWRRVLVGWCFVDPVDFREFQEKESPEELLASLSLFLALFLPLCEVSERQARTLARTHARRPINVFLLVHCHAGTIQQLC